MREMVRYKNMELKEMECFEEDGKGIFFVLWSP